MVSVFSAVVQSWFYSCYKVTWILFSWKWLFKNYWKRVVSHSLL